MEDSTPKYNTFKFNKDVETLTKLGLTEEIAIIVACANNKVPDMAQHYINQLKDEQDLIRSELANFCEFSHDVEKSCEEVGATVAPTTSVLSKVGATVAPTSQFDDV